MRETLLEKARAVVVAGPKRRSQEFLQDELEVILAFLAGDLRHGQVAAGAGMSPGAVYGWLGTRLTRAVRAGLVTVARTKEVGNGG